MLVNGPWSITCAGMIATPNNIDPDTMILPYEVTGVMSPNPTVVKVLRKQDRRI